MPCLSNPRMVLALVCMLFKPLAKRAFKRG
jgi:hypothetical protein